MKRIIILFIGITLLAGIIPTAWQHKRARQKYYNFQPAELIEHADEIMDKPVEDKPIKIHGVKKLQFTDGEADKAKTVDRGGTRGDYIGEFTVTAYCACQECCEKPKDHPEYGITASGRKVREGVTIAADWRVLPEGSKVYIEGIGERTVWDKGGAIKGKRIDVYLPNHKDTKKFGKQKLKVYKIGG
ncbi:MAG: hypothetical protein GX352_03140 [Clostridiales bacterium]|nr:hypothetical protein [Clostridiales bacterium]